MHHEIMSLQGFYRGIKRVIITFAQYGEYSECGGIRNPIVVRLSGVTDIVMHATAHLSGNFAAEFDHGWT